MKKVFLSLTLVLALLLTACATSSTTGIGTTTSTQRQCAGHIDADDNGTCDLCTGSVLVTIDFYTINDLHGKIADGESHVGVDELTTYLRAKKAAGNTILLSAGDMWQGTPESNLTQGLIITDWMNDLDFSAMVLGNHEYDWGEDAIKQNVQVAQFPILAINIYSRSTNQPVDYCQASTVVEMDGVQIGIIGAMGDCYSSIASDKTEDIYFKTGDALTALVKAESQRLRTEEGVDFVVYMLHDGYGSSTSSSLVDSNRISSYYDAELSTGYVDLVFEAHTHQGYAFQDAYGVYHMQNRGDNSGGISFAQLRINSVTGTYVMMDAALLSTDLYKNMADDPIVENLLNKYEDQIAPAKQVLGTNSRYRNSTFLCQTVAELYYQLGLETWGDQYEITLGGGFLSCRSPYNLEAGEVRYGDLQSIFPFDNDIVLCSVKGSDLLSKFINTENDRYYISGNWGQIDRNATYYIVVDTYTATYSYNNLTIVETYTPGIYARDLLADYIAAGGLA